MTEFIQGVRTVNRRHGMADATEKTYVSWIKRYIRYHQYQTFHGDDLRYRSTKVIEHDETQQQQLRRLIFVAHRYWDELPPDERDFDEAKAEFISRFA